MDYFTKGFKLILVFLLSIQCISCGTILYPERRNQPAGRIDIGVALMDGFWLLIGIIPGVIAFAVDFSTGAIYLPASNAGDLQDNHIHTVRFDPDHITPAQLEEIIRREIGEDFSFSDKRLKLTRIKNDEEGRKSVLGRHSILLF